jgi:hypothetical protein
VEPRVTLLRAAARRVVLLVDCPVCSRRVRLVSHGSGRPGKDAVPGAFYLGAHCRPDLQGTPFCTGSGRWIPGRHTVRA